MVAAAVAMVLVTPGAALADTPTSAITVSPTALQRGATFTVTETIYNPQNFVVTGAKPSLYGKEAAITDIADLVSCTVPCGALGSSYRAVVGDLAPLQSATVAFTLKVKDTAPLGTLTLQHQFVGDNYAFDTLDGAALTISAADGAADVGVTLAASPAGVLTSQITFTITAANHGPDAATGVKLQANLPNGLVFSKSSACTASGRTVTCAIASIPSGSSAKASFSVTAGLLTIGSFTTTAQRQQSSPTDSNVVNDKASRTCGAITSLLLSC
jgi:uncharacterized repeat protein (TIGR01451 family)